MECWNVRYEYITSKSCKSSSVVFHPRKLGENCWSLTQNSTKKTWKSDFHSVENGEYLDEIVTNKSQEKIYRIPVEFPSIHQSPFLDVNKSRLRN